MWTTIWQLLRDALFADKIGWLLTFLSVIASISGYTLRELFKGHENLFHSLNWMDTISIGMFIITARMIWICAKRLREFDFAQSGTYTPAKMMKHIREIVMVCNSLITGERTQETVLAETCNKLRDCMDRLTGSHCCVSIKLIEGHNDGNYEMTIAELNNQKVRNIARDNNHLSRDSEAYKTTDHYISENTAFSTIVGKLRRNKRTFYRNNNVNSNTDYITSSPYEEGELPYKSELVFAIIKKNENGNFNLKGFICIDSDKENAFNDNTLFVDLTDFIADSLFWIITYRDNGK